MEHEHVDRQPPRNEAEEQEQERLLDTGSDAVDETLATDAPDPDVAAG